MSNEGTGGSKPLKLVVCGRCKASNFISRDLPQFGTEPCKKCGHPVMLPVMMNNFELRTVVASGGMGTVYTAFDTRLSREVAIKMLKREMAEDPKVMAGFYAEARATASLNHTNIIHIYSFNEFEGRPYLVMELANHGSLDGRIEQETRVPERDVLDVGYKISSALSTALKHNLLHRDIKPGNILYNADAEPKLIDFGLVRAAEVDDSYEEHIWGTIYYVAPEKVQRRGETFQSDMYSLGGTLYHALTGHAPFEKVRGEETSVDDIVMAHVHTPLPPPNELVPEITEMTSNAIMRAMAKEPAERFESYDEMQLALEIARTYVLRQQSQQTDESTQAASTRRWWKR